MRDKTDSNGTSYSFKKANEKNTIVFVHGVGLTKEIWDPQINFFKNYNTLTYDLLGHGKTPLKKSKVKFEDFYKQLLKLINDLNFRAISPTTKKVFFNFFLSKISKKLYAPSIIE